MKFRIHGKYPDGTEDSWDIEQETIEEIQEMASQLVDSYKLTNFWSEEID